MFYKIAPNLIGLLNTLKRDIMSSINCISLAKVVEYDMEHRVCNVQLQFIPANIQYDKNLCPTGADYPILHHCPIIGEHFQSPIKEGDNCLVLFCDKCIDRWFARDERAKPAYYRKHDLSDGFVLFEIGNLANSSYIQPEGYEPPQSLPAICDCPINKYGYQQDYVRLRADSGDISIGDTNAEQRGITLCARDYSSINMYAEGSAGDATAGNIEMHPTNSFKVTTDKINFILHGDSDEGLDPDPEEGEEPEMVNLGGQITMYNDRVKKADGTIVSDMYRILAQCKVCFREVEAQITALGGDVTDIEKAVTDFDNRFKGLFTPKTIEEDEEE